VAEYVVQRLKLHDGQRAIINSTARYRVAACGRRFGKTMLAAYWLTMRDEGSAIGGKRVGWFAPNYKILLDAWRDIERSLKPIIKKSSKTEQRITLLTGGVIDFWTLRDIDAGRSRCYHRVVIDEAALAPKLEETWNKSISPTLTDYRGEAWFISSPKSGTFFEELYNRGNDNARPNWESFQLPTASNPYIPADEIEEQRLNLPERSFAQEYLAEFVQDGAGVFRRVDRLEPCGTLERGRPGMGYVIGADWGRSNDFTVYTVIELGTNHVCHIDRFTDISYPIQSNRLKALRHRFNSASIVAEANSMGQPIIEQLQRDGVPVEPFWTTNITKAQVVESLSLAIERGEFAMLENKVMRDELTAYDSERLPSGGTRYSAPPGKHDDCVISLALAWHGATQARSAPVVMRRR
jgi:hypothetical protein